MLDVLAGVVEQRIFLAIWMISGSMDHCMAELDAILDCRCSWRVAAILLGRIRALPRPQSIQCRYEYLMNLLFSMARP